jgi:hypothetical protein
MLGAGQQNQDREHDYGHGDPNGRWDAVEQAGHRANTYGDQPHAGDVLGVQEPDDWILHV